MKPWEHPLGAGDTPAQPYFTPDHPQYEIVYALSSEPLCAPVSYDTIYRLLTKTSVIFVHHSAMTHPGDLHQLPAD